MKTTPPSQMNNRWALVTGAGRGIGFEFARQLMQKGWCIDAVVRSAAQYPKLVDLAHHSEGRVSVFEADVSDLRSVEKLAHYFKVQRSHPSLDLLVNNAGVYLDAHADLSVLESDLVEESFRVNALGPLRVTQALLPYLHKSQKPIVANITSLMGSIDDNGSGGSYGYRMSKAALNMFTRSLARDYPEITVLALHPGWVRTEMGGDSAPTEAEDSVRGLIQVIERAGSKQSGEFFDYEGERLPW